MKANNFDRLCWILLIFLAFFLFATSCKTTQRTNPGTLGHLFSTVTIPYTDTIIFNEIHDHIRLDGQNHCIYIESFTTIEIDTVHLDLYITK